MGGFDLVVRGGRVFGPGDWGEIDVGVRGGLVVALGNLGASAAAKVVDARGLVVLPGLIDPHAHISLPLADGTATCDDFFTGTVAAARGGITTVIDFAEPRPGQSPGAALAERMAQAEGRAVVDYLFSVTLSSVDPDALAEVPLLVQRGVRSFKLYMVYPGLGLDDRSLLACLDAIGQAGALATVHAESAAIVESQTARLQAAGHLEAVWFPHSRPTVAEAEAVCRVLTLAGLAGARVCIRHLSSGAGLAAVAAAREALMRAAPARGASPGAGGRCISEVWVETAPHYLALDESVYGRRDGHRFIASPPLRKKEDQDALWRGIATGEVHFLGTDHCALSAGQKDRARDFLHVPGGLPGFETILSLTYTLGVHSGRIPLSRLVEITSTAAARAFGLYPRKGNLLPGADADLVLVDPKVTRRVEVGAEGLAAVLGWSPYEGWELKGWPRIVISRGEVVLEEGEFCGGAGRGLYVGVRASGAAT